MSQSGSVFGRFFDGRAPHRSRVGRTAAARGLARCPFRPGGSDGSVRHPDPTRASNPTHPHGSTPAGRRQGGWIRSSSTPVWPPLRPTRSRPSTAPTSYRPSTHRRTSWRGWTTRISGRTSRPRCAVPTAVSGRIWRKDCGVPRRPRRRSPSAGTPRCSRTPRAGGSSRPWSRTVSRLRHAGRSFPAHGSGAQFPSLRPDMNAGGLRPSRSAACRS